VIPQTNDVVAGVRRGLHERLLRDVDVAGFEGVTSTERRLRVREHALRILRERGDILPQAAIARVVNEVSDQVVGLGPIEALLRDPEISEVMVNGPNDVYVERKGRLERVPDVLFEGEEDVLHVIERIVAPLGLRVDESSPCADARLPNGSRVHAIIPPLSLRGPTLNIRKFALVPFLPQDLVAQGSLGPRMLAFLAACVRAKANIVVSGGTSSGKTTFLNVLSSFIPDGERLITIEDAAELRLSKPHVVSLEARPANVEGKGEITVRHLVRNALRMRPDRIIVGEVRGGEALDMLQAMNTGHDGSISTAHANSPRHLLWRLETMALMSDVDLPVMHIRDQVASALDIVVHMARRPDGRRTVLDISSVEGTSDGEPIVVPIFSFSRVAGTRGGFVASGEVPQFAVAAEERGAPLPATLFTRGPDRFIEAPGESPRREPASASPLPLPSPGSEIIPEITFAGETA
jgi:pilus assembly protein CpaF